MFIISCSCGLLKVSNNLYKVFESADIDKKILKISEFYVLYYDLFEKFFWPGKNA